MFFNYIMQCKLIHNGAIGFQVEDAVGTNDFSVTLQKLRRSEAVPRIAHALARMWVGEGDPNLGNLVLTKEMLDLVDTGAEKRHILHAFLVRLLQAAPNAGTLDVDTYIIYITMGAGQTDGVFAFAATQLQHDGIVVVEEVGVPFSLQWEAFGHDTFIAVFEQVRKGLVLRKSLKFVLF